MEEICLILIVFKRLLWSRATGGSGRDPWEDLDDSQMNFYEQILCFYLLCLLRPRSRKVQIASCAVRQVSQVSFNKSLPAHIFCLLLGPWTWVASVILLDWGWNMNTPAGWQISQQMFVSDQAAQFSYYCHHHYPPLHDWTKIKIQSRDAEKYFSAGNVSQSVSSVKINLTTAVFLVRKPGWNNPLARRVWRFGSWLLIRL